MSRPSRFALPTNARERLKLESTKAPALRQVHPQLAEVHVAFTFQDGTTQPPSAQSFSYFPAARGFFRYSCPCHSCDGEFDLSTLVAGLAGKSSGSERQKEVELSCSGQRAHENSERVPCPIRARINLRAVVRGKEK
ncbi:MAG: hypothetical protein ABW136_10130 [Steroidobacteraceae bacterium]